MSNDSERYFELSKKKDNDYEIDNSFIILSPKSKNEEIISSKKELEQLGLKINNFVYPYNGFTSSSQEIVKDNYYFARGGRRIGEEFPECF
jgi:hypothetical protein